MTPQLWRKEMARESSMIQLTASRTDTRATGPAEALQSEPEKLRDCCCELPGRVSESDTEKV